MAKASDAAAAVSFPAVFFDGDREVDLGPVVVHPSIGFRKLQAVISERIGVAPHQISTSLVRRKKDASRKVPLDDSSDLAAVARERDCFLLAVLRRSRRDRPRRSRRHKEAPSPPERTIMKRGSANSGGGVDHPFAVAGLWDYESQLTELQRQRERYLMSTAAVYHPYTAAGWAGYGIGGGMAPATTGNVPLPECEVCAAEGVAAPFHWCVRDAVTVGFRSPAGPIQRPPKVGG